jgi:hypothetical protein
VVLVKLAWVRLEWAASAAHHAILVVATERHLDQHARRSGNMCPVGVWPQVKCTEARDQALRDCVCEIWGV